MRVQPSTAPFRSALVMTVLALASPSVARGADKKDIALAQITQQIYGDNLSGANGEVYVRLFADSNLGSFKVIKNLAGTASREATVPAGNVVVSNTTITVTLPA